MNNFETLLRGIIGIIFVLGVCYLLSSNKSKVKWNIVLKGLLIQFIFAICILKIPVIEYIFNGVSNIFLSLLNFTKDGSILFGETLVNDPSFGAIFAFQILPTIVFFSALTSVLFYLGILQKIVYFLHPL